MAQICFSVVQAVIVDMVNAHTFRWGQYISVHPYCLSVGTFVALSSADCIEHLFCSLEVPFVFV